MEILVHLFSQRTQIIVYNLFEQSDLKKNIARKTSIKCTLQVMAGGEWSSEHFRVILGKWDWRKTTMMPLPLKGENQKVKH